MPNLPSQTDVLIVGAGPVGLALAIELQRNRIPHVIIDKLPEGANTSRAVAIHARTLEALELCGVTRDLVARGVQVPIFRLRDRDRLLVEISFSEIPSRYPFVLMLPQDQTEQILSNHLRAAGGDVARPWEAIHIEDKDDGFVNVITEQDGTQASVRARYVAGCDGMHSFVRDWAGIQYEGGSYQEGFFLADAGIDWPPGPTEVSLFYSPHGIMVIAPLADGQYRIVAALDNPPPDASAADVQKILDERGPGIGYARVENVTWNSRFMIHHRIAQSMRKNRLILAGDSAHVHSPAGGQGMNTGIQEAIGLGQALNFVLAGRDEDQTRLEEWSKSRLEIAKRVVRFTDRLTRVATVQSTTLQNLRNAALEFAGRITPLKEVFAENLAELHNR
jgi:2-polyprenyl-6-methoxyphenol hydroxylase-like FAD-dependent oxidoreductase